MEAKLYLSFKKTTEQFCFLKIRTNSELGIRNLILSFKKKFFIDEGFIYLSSIPHPSKNLILIPKCLNKRLGWPKA